MLMLQPCEYIVLLPLLVYAVKERGVYGFNEQLD